MPGKPDAKLTDELRELRERLATAEKSVRKLRRELRQRDCDRRRLHLLTSDAVSEWDSDAFEQIGALIELYTSGFFLRLDDRANVLATLPFTQITPGRNLSIYEGKDLYGFLVEHHR